MPHSCTLQLELGFIGMELFRIKLDYLEVDSRSGKLLSGLVFSLRIPCHPLRLMVLV